MDTPDSSNRTSKAVPRERAHMRRRGRDMPARLEPPAPPAAARQRMGIGIGIGDRGHVCGRPRARSVSSGRSHESRGAGRPGSVHPAWTGRRPEPCRATPPNLLDPSFVCPRKRRARRGRRRLPGVDRLKYPLSLFFFFYSTANPFPSVQKQPCPRSTSRIYRRSSKPSSYGSALPPAAPAKALLLLLRASGTKRHELCCWLLLRQRSAPAPRLGRCSVPSGVFTTTTGASVLLLLRHSALRIESTSVFNARLSTCRRSAGTIIPGRDPGPAD